MKSQKIIDFEIALEGGDYEAPSQSEHGFTTFPDQFEWTDWSDWSSCFPECGSGSSRTRSRICDGGNEFCAGEKEETEACTDVPSCTVDKHECVADSQGQGSTDNIYFAPILGVARIIMSFLIFEPM